MKPLQVLFVLIEPNHPKTSPNRGRPPYPFAIMQQIQLLQHWYSLNDPSMRDALIEVPATRRFGAFDMISERIPDESTISRYGTCWRLTNLANRSVE